MLLPETLDSIAANAFFGCEGLVAVEIPKGVTGKIDCFGGCTRLESVTIPEGVSLLGGFSGCSSLTSIEIPAGVTEILGKAFKGCTGLTSIVLPDDVQTIGTEAFFGCKNLGTITFGSGLIRIHDFAFEDCDGLTTVMLPDSLEDIGELAFADCSGLKSVTIGKGINRIRRFAFRDCQALEDFYCYAETPPGSMPEGEEMTIFDNSYIGFATLHVPESAIETYRSTAPWSEFGQIVAIEGTGIRGVNASGSSADSPCYNLAGQKVNTLYKGIVIQKGKKRIIH